MKIIFLDMDGVLCTTRAHVSAGHTGLMNALDPVGVGLLNRLVFDDVKFVLSSTWRKHFSKEEMEGKLKQYGWAGEFHTNWCTGYDLTRGREIDKWREGVELESFVIFDDETHDFNGRKLQANLVLTKFETGITFEDFILANQILHDSPSEWKKHNVVKQCSMLDVMEG